MLLVGTAILLVIIVVGSGIAFDLSVGGVAAVWWTIIFFAWLGWPNRRHFRSLRFCLFFLAWMLLTALVGFTVFKYHYSFLFCTAALLVDAFCFYMSAFLLFGLKLLPTRGKMKLSSSEHRKMGGKT